MTQEGRGKAKNMETGIEKRRRSRLVMAVACGAVICCVAMGYGSLAHSRRELNSSGISNGAATALAQPSASPGAAQGSPPEKLRVAAITLTPRGFEPAEFSLPPGNLHFAVFNRTGLPAVTLLLEQEEASASRRRLQEARVPREILDWRKLVHLQPGSYVLTEADHPEWACRITVTDR